MIMVSTLIMTFNQEKYIEQAIKGVLSQKINFKQEIIIVDDNSRDSTFSICESYRKKYPHIIKLLSSQKNLGISPNFLRMLRECRGKYIAMLDGDDYWIDQYKIKKQIDFFREKY